LSERIERIQRGYEALDSSDGSFENWHEDFVWDMSTFRGWPEAPQYHGVEGYQRFMQDWLEGFDHWQLEIERYYEAGDHVVTICRQRGSAKASGANVDMRFGQVWTFRGDKVSRCALYADPDEALAAAGVDG
jgi:ketosteroid isomerase-like protein